MKFLHTGDLHIGKTICDFSLLEDQRHMLSEIVQAAVREKADAVVVAGDIYDRAVPSAEAVIIWDRFLTELVELRIPVIMISGNHDSPERIAFASEILKNSGVYAAGPVEVDEPLKQVKLQDEEGDVIFVLLPFVKPAVALARSNIEAVEKILAGVPMDSNARYVLVTHYFVTDSGRQPILSEAETTIHVGGLDHVEVGVFKDFDYVALGHIHRVQQIGDTNVFYAGAPLQYSFSEAGQTKSVNLVELGKKGELKVTEIPLVPLRQMRKIRGRMTELMNGGSTGIEGGQDYIQATLLDEDELIDPIGLLRTVYPNIMQILLAKNEITDGRQYVSRMSFRKRGIPELFQEFYEIVRGDKPDEARMQVILQAAGKAGEVDA